MSLGWAILGGLAFGPFGFIGGCLIGNDNKQNCNPCYNSSNIVAKENVDICQQKVQTITEESDNLDDIDLFLTEIDKCRSKLPKNSNYDIAEISKVEDEIVEILTLAGVDLNKYGKYL